MRRFVLIFIIVLGLISCGDKSQPVPNPSASTSNNQTQPTQASGNAPTNPPAPTSNDLKIEAVGFGQAPDDPASFSSGAVNYGFKIQNTNPVQAYELIEYTAIAYDSAGAKVGENKTALDYIAPNELTASSGEISVSSGVAVAKVEITLTNSGKLSQSYPLLTSEKVEFMASDKQPDNRGFVSGFITTTSDREVVQGRLVALAYDESGAIIGASGTLDTVSFVSPQSQTPVRIQIVTQKKPAKVELYAGYSGFTLAKISMNRAQKAAQSPQLVKQGFGQNAEGVGFGFIVKNPNVTPISLKYAMVIYGEANEIVDVVSGDISNLAPNAEIGVADNRGKDMMGKPFTTKISKIQVVFNEGNVAEDDQASFEVRDVAYDGSDFTGPAVRGKVKNIGNESKSFIKLSVLAFDEQGNIIGGGHGAIDSLDANAENDAVSAIYSGAIPATVQLYVNGN